MGKKSVLCIGGSGFVGSRLIELLNNESEITVKNVDKNPSPFFDEITTIANVLEEEQMNQLLEGVDIVVLLAAEHRDDVSPKTLYYDVNVQGMRNVLNAMDKNNVKNIIFTSSVAVYGLNKENPNENHPVDPFNDYGKSKWQAEQLLSEWYKKGENRTVNIVRPTVIFGERNRGNVYNLLKQITSGKFLMIGKGENKKSMAYVGNIVAFIRFLIDKQQIGYNVFNYVDKPDFTMNELLGVINETFGTKSKFRVPYFIGIMGGYAFDLLAKITGKKYSVSSIRIKKFCATTQFDAQKAMDIGFVPPFTLAQGLEQTLKFEFIDKRSSDEITFETE